MPPAHNQHQTVTRCGCICLSGITCGFSEVSLFFQKIGIHLLMFINPFNELTLLRMVIRLQFLYQLNFVSMETQISTVQSFLNFAILVQETELMFLNIQQHSHALLRYWHLKSLISEGQCVKPHQLIPYAQIFQSLSSHLTLTLNHYYDQILYKIFEM